MESTKYFLITGNCGSGKTWVMKQLLERFNITHREKQGLYHWVHDGETAILGKYDGSMFEGSDRLAMNIMAQNVEIKPLLDKFRFVVAEGDRFTNSTFIKDFKPIIIRIKDDGLEGRAKRGSEQNERHIKSIATRVKNIEPNYITNNSEECAKIMEDFILFGFTNHPEYIAPKTTLF